MFEVLLAILASALAFAGGYFVRFHQDKLSEKERVRRRLEDLHRRLLEFSHRLRDAWFELYESPSDRRRLASEVRILIRNSLPIICHLQQVHANDLNRQGADLYTHASGIISHTSPNSNLAGLENEVDALANEAQDFANDVLGQFALNSPVWPWSIGPAIPRKQGEVRREKLHREQSRLQDGEQQES